MHTAAPYDIVYLSPHLDDAVFSCGGQIARAARSGRRQLIATAFAGGVAEEEPGSPPPSPASDAPGLVAERREEDRRAACSLGVDVLHGPFPDAFSARDPATGQRLYPTIPALWGAMHPAHRAQLPGVTRWLGELPPHRVLVAPLGLGRHVDHRLLRLAAERHAGRSLVYFEDFPYAQRWRYRCPWVRALWGWRWETVRLAPEELAARVAAAAAYSSQVRAVFGTAETLDAQIRRYVRRAGGERIWRRR